MILIFWIIWQENCSNLRHNINQTNRLQHLYKTKPNKMTISSSIILKTQLQINHNNNNKILFHSLNHNNNSLYSKTHSLKTLIKIKVISHKNLRIIVMLLFQVLPLLNLKLVLLLLFNLLKKNLNKQVSHNNKK